MKRTVLFVLLWLALVLLCAQESVLLRNSQHLAFDGVTVQLPNAATLVFWNDTSSGTSDIYAQKLASDGSSLWTSARPIVSQPLDQRIINAVYTSDDCVILLYMDFPIGEYGSALRLQKISLAGQLLWNAEGMLITNTEYPSQKNQIALMPNNVGGAFVVSYQNGAIAYNYSASGVNQWPESVLFTISNFLELQALSDNDGGLMINCSSYNSGNNNRVVHLDAGGDTIGNFDFSLPGLPIPNQFRMLRNTAGQYILYGATDTAVGMQIMDIAGNLQLPELLTIPYALSNVYSHQLKMIPIADGGLLYTYLGHADYNASIALHRLNSNLQPMWATPVTFLNLGNCQSYDLAINSANDTWLTWTNGYPEFNVSAVRINADGTNAFAPLLISSGNHFSDIPLVFASADKACFVWNNIKEDRNSLSCQVLSNSGTPQLVADGRSIYSVLNGSTELSACKSLDNKFIYVYRDSRFYDREKIYYQITNNEITPLLEANGKALNPTLSDGESYLDCVATAYNKLLLLYAVFQGNDPELYLQEVDQNGNHTWPGKGLLVASNPAIDINRCQISLVNDDVLVTWNTFTSDANMGIKGQRYHDGAPMWEAGGKTLLDAGTNFASLLDMHGNYLVYSYESYPNNYSAIHALLIDDSGNPATGWPATGQALVESTPFYYQIYSQSGLVDNNLVCILTNFDNSGLCTRGQTLSLSGEKLWGENGLLLETDDNWILYQVTDAAFGEFVSCVGNFDASSQWFLHKISPSGEMLFGQTGITIDYAWTTTQSESKLIQYANGGYSVFWTTSNDALGYSINHRYVSANGTVTDSAPLNVVSDVAGFYSSVTAEHDNIGVLAYNSYQRYYLRGPDDVPMNSLWACRRNALPTSIEDDYQAAPMLSCSNYPNPFNPETTIQFTLREANPVLVEVYNLKGQLIKSLVNEDKTSGLHKVTWNGCDNNGRSVASGMYLYKIKAGTYSSSRKMMLMK